MKKDTSLIELFLTFFRIGLFTFGGGYVMIPFIEKEMVNKKNWIEHDEIIDIIAITQSIPGALATNMSALVGYKILKIRGAITAVLAVISPSIIIIVLIALFFTQFQDLEIVNNAFLGIRSMVVALILVSAIKITKTAVKDIYTLLITVTSVGLLIFSNIHPIIIIISGALFGLLTYVIEIRKAIKRSDDLDTN